MKLTRRQRRKEAESARSREEDQKKAGKPYTRKRIHTCFHCFVLKSGFLEKGLKENHLTPVSDTECVCEVCRKRFSMDDYRAVESWADDYIAKPLSDLVFLEFPINSTITFSTPQPVIKPVAYYYTGPDTIAYAEEDGE